MTYLTRIVKSMLVVTLAFRAEQDAQAISIDDFTEGAFSLYVPAFQSGEDTQIVLVQRDIEF
jgi:hypothetical protein